MEYTEKSEQIKDLEYNGQPVKLKSPGMKAFPYFLRVSREMIKLTKANEGKAPEEMMASLSNETIEDLSALVEMVVKHSFKGEPEDKLNDWVTTNGMTLMFKVLDLFTPSKSKNDIRKEDVIKRIQDAKSSA